MRFLLRLDGVQSARVPTRWLPGEFSVPAGVSPEEQSRLITDIQSKCREESVSWAELEDALTTECKQVLDIADAHLATSSDKSVGAAHQRLLNYTEYRELFLRAERLHSHTRRRHGLGIDGLLKMGEAYWDAFEQRKNGDPGGNPPAT